MTSSLVKSLYRGLGLAGLSCMLVLGFPPEAVAACGGVGQSACKIWERIPSCNSGLMEVGGRCESCGAEGQRACSVTVRIPSCNSGLVEDFSNNRCKRPATASREPVEGVDCGSKDGVTLPCWADFRDDDEGNESLPLYPYAKRPNGCTIPGGPPGSQDRFTSFGNTFSFTEPCNNHDVCYYTLGSKALDCNRAFYNDLTSACGRPLSQSSDAVSRELAKHECLTRRDGMTAAVTAGQGKFHVEAQGTQSRYQERVAQYLRDNGAASSAAATSGYVTLQNRWKADQSIHIEHGRIESGPIYEGAHSAQWVQVPVDGTSYIRFQNRWKADQFIHIEHGQIESGPIHEGAHSAQWSKAPVSGTSYVRFQNRWKADQYIHIEHGRIESGPIQSGWWSAHWQEAAR